MKKIVFFVGYAVVLAFFVLMAWYVGGCPDIGIDDAYIFFSYAKNIANGAGFVYGGTSQPVEGCTSFLWTIFCAMSYWLHFDKTGILVLSFLCLVFTHLTWIFMLRKMCPEKNEWLLSLCVFLAFIISSPTHLCWMSYTLMDVSVYALSIALLTRVIMIPERRVIGGMLFFCIPLIRPEMMLLGIFALVLYLCSGFGMSEYAYRKKSVFIYLGLFSLSLLGLTLFRMLYFGYPFPNTFYAKVSPSLMYNLSLGAVYFLLFFAFGTAWWGMFCFSIAISIVRWIRDRSKMVILCIWFCVLLAPPILAGGDHFGYYRFYQPLYPLMGYILAMISVKLWNEMNIQSRVVAYCGMRFASLSPICVGLIIGCAFSLQPSWRMFRSSNELSHEFAIAQTGINNGRAMNDVFVSLEKLPTIGVITAGGIATEYRGKIVDVMGLNNVQIAHHKGNRKGVKNHAAFSPELFPKLGIDIVITDIVGAKIFLKGMERLSWFVNDWRFGIFSRSAVNSPKVFARKELIEKSLKCGITFKDVATWNGQEWIEIE